MIVRSAIVRFDLGPKQYRKDSKLCLVKQSTGTSTVGG